jgi:3-oxoacyl-(acyl-carrier-protein) synthase
MKIIIRSMGLVTALGQGIDNTVECIRSGENGLNDITVFPSPLRNRIPVCEVKVVESLTANRCRNLALMAIREALTGIGLNLASPELASFGLFAGCISGDLLEAEVQARTRLQQDPSFIPLLCSPGSGNMTAQLAEYLGVDGPLTTINTACTSSANALLLACQAIRSGIVDRMIVVGCDALNATTLHGFSALMLLDENGCFPFDTNRNGIQIGEGASAVVLERESESGGSEYPELLGGSTRCFPYHPTATSPDGKAGIAVMETAMESTGVTHGDITAVKAHGTGSTNNDIGEGVSIHSVFDGNPPPVTSLKRYVGHTMGAAGLVEMVAFLSCAARGFIPACLGFSNPDPQCRIVPLDHHKRVSGGTMMLNYFGFGGSSTSLIVRMPDGQDAPS